MAKATCGSRILWRTARVLAAVLVFAVVSTPAAAQGAIAPIGYIERARTLEPGRLRAVRGFARMRKGDCGKRLR
jgi:hypothetical protein